MSPECPKGQEREARPEESLRERISRAIQDEAPVWEEQFPAGPGIVCSVSDASIVAARTVAPELERLTAEVEQLRKHGETQAAIIDGWVRYGRRTNDQKREWRAEVSRLREQLAAQPPLPDEAALCDRIERAQSEWWHGHNYTAAGHNEDPSNCCWCYESADVAAKTVLALLGDVSSSEVEAPRPKLPHHNVTMQSENVKGDEWEAYCHECTALKAGTMAEVKFWRDQHEADTLRTSVESPNHQANQHDEGRPSGSGRLAPRPVGTLLERIAYRLWHLEIEPAGWTDDQVASAWAALMDVDSTADEGKWGGWWAAAKAALAVVEPEFGRQGADVLREMAAELLEQCDDWDDEYGVCAKSVPDPACRIRAIVNRYAIQEDAAQAARSEATPEAPSSPPSGGDSDTTPRVWTVGDPEPDESVQTVRAANSQVFRRIWLRSVRHPLWQAGIGGQVTWAVMLGAVGPVTEVLPSPSLHKKGEDTPSLTDRVLADVAAERDRQESKWGQQNHADRMPADYPIGDRPNADLAAAHWKNTNSERVAWMNDHGMPKDRNAAWDGILLEEVYEALAETDSPLLRMELIQVAAVAVAWVEAIDRRVSAAVSSQEEKKEGETDD